MTTMTTYYGNTVDLADPKVSTIDIRDIARSLARTPRFVAHTSGVTIYSVAEHSFWVTRLIETWHETNSGGRGDPQRRRAVLLAALLHDASEAYTGDLSRPLKQTLRLLTAHDGKLSVFDVVEAKLQSVIYQRFIPLVDDTATDDGIADAMIVKDADNLMAAVERKKLMPPTDHQYDTPEVAVEAEALLRSGLSVNWPQNLRFPLLSSVDWEELFLLKFSVLVGGPQ